LEWYPCCRLLFHFLCVQHVSDINISIIRSLRLFCWITTLVVLFLVRCVLAFRCGWFGVVSVLQAEEVVLQPATIIIICPSTTSPVGRSSTGTDYYPSNSLFPRQCQSTPARYSASSPHCSYQNDKGAKLLKMPQKNALSEIWDHWIESLLYLFFLCGVENSFLLLIGRSAFGQYSAFAVRQISG